MRTRNRCVNDRELAAQETNAGLVSVEFKKLARSFILVVDTVLCMRFCFASIYDGHTCSREESIYFRKIDHHLLLGTERNTSWNVY